MDIFSHVPPGFRFHPSDEELVDYYLRKKVDSKRIDVDVIKDVDLYKIEPWDLQELCKIAGSDEENEWYFFSHKDKKYPSGSRTNRATKAGFWKATGREKPIYSHCQLIGMRKTLVFYKGRAPNGHKSHWIMHEYRLQPQPQEEARWAVCRVFIKRMTTQLSFMQCASYPCSNNNANALQSLSLTQEEQHCHVHQQSLQVDWKFVASQLSHHDQHFPKETTYSNMSQQIKLLANGCTKTDIASTSTASCQIDLWK